MAVLTCAVATWAVPTWAVPTLAVLMCAGRGRGRRARLARCPGGRARAAIGARTKRTLAGRITIP
jgi:hypothetical protein